MDIILIILKYAAAAAIGYGFGCINPAYIMAKIKGIDIIAQGSHNPGASNATVTMGWKTGVLVGLLDIFKAFAAVMIANAIFPALAAAGVAAGTACVVGHIFPATHHFRGGKGFAAFLGMVLALDWRFFLIIAAGIIVISLITDYIAIATLASVVAEPVMLACIKAQYIVMAVVCVASLMVIYRHLENFRRIVKGEEIGIRKALFKKV